MEKKNNIVYLFFIFIILILTWPIFGAWFTIFQRSWIWLGIALFFSLFSVSLFYRSKQFLWLVFYMLFVLLNYLVGDNYFNNAVVVFNEFLYLCIPSAILFLFISYKKEKYNHLLIYLTLLFIVFVTIASFVFNQLYPEVIRENQSSLNLGIRAPLSILERYGLSNYGLPHAIPVLIPAISYHMKSKGKKVRNYLVYGGLIILCVILTYISGAVTPFLLSLLLVLLCLLIREGNARYNYRIFVIFFIAMLFLYSDSLLLSFLHFVDAFLGQQTTLHARLMEIETAIIYGSTEGDLGAREDLYINSIKAFLGNVFIGSDSPMGDHSAILDRLGTLGLLGFVPYCLFIISELKFIIKHIPIERRFFYYASILAAISMLSLKNMSNWPMWCFLFVIAPLILNEDEPLRRLHSKQQLSR